MLTPLAIDSIMLFLKKHVMRVRVTVWSANAIPLYRPAKGSRAQLWVRLGAQSKKSDVTQSLAICRLLEDAPLAVKDLLLLLGLSSNHH